MYGWCARQGSNLHLTGLKPVASTEFGLLAREGLVVGPERLELSRTMALVPKTSASSNSATGPLELYQRYSFATRHESHSMATTKSVKNI